VADRATAWEREGRRLASKRGPGDSVLVQETAYVSDLESENGQRRQRRRRSRRSPPAMLFKDGRLLVHKSHEGVPGLPLCYYATGLKEGGPHDVYACFDKRDIVWERRVRFHNERNRY
jgi:hypothetical protein